MRVLTSNDYVEMVREKDKKEKEAAELKMKCKEERELKRIEKEKERERKKKEREEKKKQKGNKRGNKRKSQCQNTAHKPPRINDEGGTEEQHVSSSDNEEENRPSSSRRTLRSVRPPSWYCDDFDSDVSTTVCTICDAREPPIKESLVFWVDCDECGEWAHKHCAFGCNTATRHFLCSSCCM